MRYTIIIPHFNDCRRLDRLLRSIPSARKDVEVIVVDDCSPDQPGLNALKACWPLVKWLSTAKNMGAGAARNLGLAAARGERIVFADSDDEFLPSAFDVFDQYVRPKDQLVYFLAEAVQEVNGLPSNRAERMNELCKSYLASPDETKLDRLRLGHVNPVAKIYLRSYTESIGVTFEETRVGNDVIFNVIAAVQAVQINVVPISVYRVFRRANSLTTNENLQNMILRMKTLSRLNDQLALMDKSIRMHGGSYLYRSLQKGPKTFYIVFIELIKLGLFWPTFRKISFTELYRFWKSSRKERRERSRLAIYED